MEQKVINNRLDWMDWAKSIAITLVVFGHILMPFSKWVFGFHMPFFFMLSGFLQKKRTVRDEAINSFKSLLLPYVIYNVYLLIYSLFTGEYASNYPLDMLWACSGTFPWPVARCGSFSRCSSCAWFMQPCHVGAATFLPSAASFLSCCSMAMPP